ncbi:hypothetical protein [Aestuariivivens sediminicola]|uniref:hypothetical protein n=1 Tax=Aestuariivivens sediminicola TaxID=2913560 RepID=UPI001F59C404|nr:hypothetical protein [Aestuariivivens sediminicola]
MKMTIISMLLFGLFAVSTGCSDESTEVIPNQKVNNLELLQYITDVSSGVDVSSKSGSNKSENSGRERPPVWADCIEYTAIVVPATFKPGKGNFDELYMMPEAMFYGGLPLISDSKPGDQDYNGGRWHMNLLKDGVDASKYAMACSEEDLDPNDFDSIDLYFECPLLPKR